MRAGEEGVSVSKRSRPAGNGETSGRQSASSIRSRDTYVPVSEVQPGHCCRHRDPQDSKER